MKDWLDKDVTFSYRDLFHIMNEHSKVIMNCEDKEDIEAFSFDTILQLYKLKNEDEFPYNLDDTSINN